MWVAVVYIAIFVVVIPVVAYLVAKPRIISIAGEKPTGTTINLFVEKTRDTMELFNLVKVNMGVVWNVYDTNNVLISNKVVSLDDENNTFYIEVSLPDGGMSTIYTLNIVKS